MSFLPSLPPSLLTPPSFLPFLPSLPPSLPLLLHGLSLIGREPTGWLLAEIKTGGKREDLREGGREGGRKGEGWF